jgi:hypothetical protein
MDDSKRRLQVIVDQDTSHERAGFAKCGLCVRTVAAPE